MANLDVEFRGAVAVLCIDNETKLNALTGAILKDLAEQLEQLGANPTVRGLILTGAGDRAFCAGADIKEWSQYEAFEFAREWIALGHRVLDQLTAFPKPVIAAINGMCFGGGLELAGACDVRVATTGAQFALPETSIGINPGWSGVQRLGRLIPEALLREMALTGARLSAQRLYDVGFVNVLADGDPMPDAREIAARTCSLAPRAVEVTKAVLNTASGEAKALLVDQLAGALLAKTADSQEGIAAFKEKRNAEFSGE